MGKELGVELQVVTTQTVDLARVEKDAWKDAEEFAKGATEDRGPTDYRITKLRQLAHERFLYWQREEELRRKALRLWRDDDE